MSDENIYLTELTKQKSRIQNALDDISNGTIPNMDDIEQDLVALCGAIENASPEIARKTEGELRSMISMLEDLAGRIEDFQKTLKDE